MAFHDITILDENNCVEFNDNNYPYMITTKYLQIRKITPKKEIMIPITGKTISEQRQKQTIVIN